MGKLCLGCLLWCLAAGIQAQSFCLLSASSYYEQVYCELQARGEARGLPPFHQFKRNDEKIQATLLRRPAARIGIDLPMPSRDVSTPVQAQPFATPLVAANSESESLTQEKFNAAGGDLDSCRLFDIHIDCGERRYQLVGNRLNHRLADTALTDTNLMDLPVFSGNLKDQQALNQYLSMAYIRYIEKMHEIGLAGATLTYGKFVYLFYDVQSKGLNFGQRFETMYGFLKQDKARMSVSEKITHDPNLALADCAPLTDTLLVCQRAGRNYLYLASSGT